MKRILLSTLLLITLFRIQAQDTTYAKVFYDSSIYIETQAAALNLDKAPVIVGSYDYYDAFILNLDSVATEQWGVTLSHFQERVIYTDVITSSDSSYIAAGVVEMNAIPVFVKYDDQGDTLWTRTFGSIGQWDASTTYLMESSDSNIVAVWSYVNSGVKVVKMDLSGNIIWSHHYDGAESAEAKSIIEGSDGAIYIAAGTSGGGMIFKLDQSGDLIWAKKTLDSTIEDLMLVDDTLFIACSVNGWEGGLMKADTALNIEWAYGYQSYYEPWMMGLNVSLTMSKDSAIMLNIPTMMGFSGRIYKLTMDGNIMEEANKVMGVTEILPTEMNGLYIIGNGPTWGVKLTNNHMGVLREDSTILATVCSDNWGGGLQPFIASFDTVTYTDIGTLSLVNVPYSTGNFSVYNYYGCVDFLGGLDEESMPDVEVYPNISSGVIHFRSDDQSRMSLTIYNALGQEVYSGEMTGGYHMIDLSDQLSGMYHYSLSNNESGQAVSGKLILE